MFPQELSEAVSAQVQRLTLIVGARVGDVTRIVSRVTGEAFVSEGPSDRGDCGDESSAGFDTSAENDPALYHYEKPVGLGPAFVNIKSCRPCRLGTIRARDSQLLRCQPGGLVE